jgi:predicted nucleic acid-binding protein
LKAADTSVIVAAFASWHERHTAARRALDGGLRMIEHCALETYSVLTRLPAPHRAPGAVVRDFLAERFPQPYLRLSGPAFRRFLLTLPEDGVTGGVAYDALIGAIAVDCGAELYTCDSRALPVYERYGVHYHVIS